MDNGVCECGEPRAHRHEFGMRVFTPSKPEPVRAVHDSHTLIGPVHMAQLLEMIDPTGQHGITRGEFAKIYYGNMGDAGVLLLNRILEERCPDRPELRFLDLPSLTGPLEVRELMKELGIPIKRLATGRHRATRKHNRTVPPSRRHFGAKPTAKEAP